MAEMGLQSQFGQTLNATTQIPTVVKIISILYLKVILGAQNVPENSGACTNSHNVIVFRIMLMVS
jgi:hypothetical protein